MVQEAAASLIVYHRVGYTVYKVLKAPRVITSQIGTKNPTPPFPNDKKRKFVKRTATLEMHAVR